MSDEKYLTFYLYTTTWVRLPIKATTTHTWPAVCSRRGGVGEPWRCCWVFAGHLRRTLADNLKINDVGIDSMLVKNRNYFDRSWKSLTETIIGVGGLVEQEVDRRKILRITRIQFARILNLLLLSRRVASLRVKRKSNRNWKSWDFWFWGTTVGYRTNRTEI